MQNLQLKNADRDAIARYESFLDEDPENTLIQINLGHLYHRNGQFDKAVACFTACLHDVAYRNVAKGHLAKVKLSQNQVQEAERLFEELIASGDDDPALHHNLGIALYCQRRWQDAQHAFEAARDKGLGVGNNLRYLAFSLHQQRKMDAARAVTQQWLDAVPAESEQALGYASLLELELGDRQAAQQLADEALHQNPDNVDAAYTKSIGFIEQQEIDKAERLLLRILDKQPQSFRALQGLGMVYYYRQEFDKAIQFLERALQVIPKQVGVFITIGWAYLAKQDVLNAERAFRRAIAAEPNFGEAHGGMAAALALQKRVKEAREEITIARRLDPKGFGAVYAQSVLLAIEGREETAAKLIERVLKQPLGPGAPNIAESIALYFKKQGLAPPPEAEKGP